MSVNIHFEVEGHEKFAKALKSKELLEGPMRDFLSKSAAAVEKSAGEKVPRDTGHLAQNIFTLVQPPVATVTAATKYAAPVEKGSRPHFPPPRALESWARHHGVSAFALAVAISRRGTRPQPFMRPALEENKAKIRQFLQEAAKEIERRWERGSI